MRSTAMKLILALTIMAFAGAAHAQATRTWVSGVGDDANPCSRTAPCKTFAGAISKTASPGIINCLDPAGYGAVTITKSIEIDCGYTLGSILHSGVQGIIVNALTTDTIVLRGLSLNGSGTTLGTNGVNIIQAKNVHVYNTNVAKISGNGIQTTNSTNSINLFIENAEILNAGGAGVLIASTGSGTARLSVSNSKISSNAKGIEVASGNSSAQVTGTVLSFNTSDGFKITPGTSGGAVDNMSIFSNGNGINVATAGGDVRISRSLIHGNLTNGLTGAGSTHCFGTNVINGNIGNNTCTNPLQAMQ